MSYMSSVNRFQLLADSKNRCICILEFGYIIYVSFKLCCTFVFVFVV